jgi:hypothetical protein
MQEEAIIAWLIASDHNPLALAINPPGKAGVKSCCKKYLTAKQERLFCSGHAFDSAWKRLKREMRIIDRKP